MPGEEMAQLLVSIFAPIISAVVTIMVVVPASYHAAIHKESNWRARLMELCSIEVITDKKILELRALANPYRKPNRDLDLDNIIIKFCDNYYNHITAENSKKVARQFRMIARTLLKHDWNYSKHIILRWKIKKKNKDLVTKLKQYLESDEYTL